MPELPFVVPGEDINSTTFGNPVIQRVVSRYADATARDFAVPVPLAGDPAYLTATSELQVFDGTEWVTYANLSQLALKVAKAGDTMTGRLLVAFTGNAAIGHVEIDGVGGVPALVMKRNAATEWWRLAQNNTGPFVIQMSDDGGTTWTTALEISTGRRVTFPEPTISTAPNNDSADPGYGFPTGGGLFAGAAGTSVGIAGPDGEWVAVVSNNAFTVLQGASTELDLRTFFTVPKVYDETATDVPNVTVNSSGAIRRSTTLAARQVDLEALEALVTALQAQVDAL